jgi:ABC-type transport system involved in cytochrome bd biosynthesis fused ATPase/permease subunit
MTDLKRADRVSLIIAWVFAILMMLSLAVGDLNLTLALMVLMMIFFFISAVIAVTRHFKGDVPATDLSVR